MSEQSDDPLRRTNATTVRAAGPLADLPVLRRPRAARLIEQILRTGTVSVADLAAAVVTDEATLDACRLGRARMSLDRQLCLALVAIEQVPAARRAGYALKAQVEAELAVNATLTETHDEPPVSHRWP